MDTVCKAQRLRPLALLFALLVLLLVAAPAAAYPLKPSTSDYPKTYAGQQAWCEAAVSWSNAYAGPGNPADFKVTKGCTLEHPANAGAQWYDWKYTTQGYGSYVSTTFDITAPGGGGCDPSQATSTGCPTPPGDICKSRPSRPGIMGSNLSICFQGCSYKPTNPLDGMDGGLRTCVAGVGGACSTQATYKPTGGTCGDGPGTDTTPPPPPPAMPKLCGGGSCYDPNTGKGCALDANGNQVCMDVKPGAPGGCISSGETTLCGGNPPPLPPQDKIPDPPSDIVGSDNYGQQPIDGSGNGGSINNTTINNYNNGTSGTSTPNNGGTAGDAGTPTGGDPASPSSTSGPPSSVSGGGDCNTPPVCSGDAIQCALVRQGWQVRCSVEDTNKVFSPDGLSSDPEGDGKQAVAVESQDLGGGTGMTGIDSSGHGFPRTCPIESHSVVLMGQTITIDYTKLCDYLDFGGMLVMVLAYLAAARIIME